MVALRRVNDVGGDTARRFRPLMIAAQVLLAAGAMYVGDRVIDPLPTPAATMAAGGLGGMWIGRRRRGKSVAIGAAFGLAAGVGLHLWSHYSEGRMNPEGGLLPHVAVDTAQALVIAGIALALAASFEVAMRSRGRH